MATRLSLLKMRPRRRMTLIFFTCLFLSLAQVLELGSAPDNRSEKSLWSAGCLYPYASESRDVKNLDGIWNFRIATKNYKTEAIWPKTDLSQTGPVIPMPVPSSYNDVTSNKTIRDHVGPVWYDTRFFVSPYWLKDNQRIWLRFSSVHYTAKVWVNGKLVGTHAIGHLPFAIDITNVVQVKVSNLLTVLVDNTLNEYTVPQGRLNQQGKQEYGFDFFNYAGIHRSVFLYTTPQAYIDEVMVKTKIGNITGYLHAFITCKGGSGKKSVRSELYDRDGTLVGTGSGTAMMMAVENVILWWPYLMHDKPGYLYTLKVTLTSKSDKNFPDVYYLKVGFRTIKWDNSSVYINKKPVYFRGFGMHEDSDWRGKGWDPVLWTKNFDLIKWTGANVFRTSHYPYAEEIYQLADEQGIMIIDECSSVNTESFSSLLLKNHKQSLSALIRRDQNHPSVVMWSLANEPETSTPASVAHFEQVSKHVKTLDISRPVTIAISQGLVGGNVAALLDVIAFNRYIGWYMGPSDLSYVVEGIVSEAKSWHENYKKPVIIMEYGADTIAGMHSTTDTIFSEDYQVALMSEHFKAFDELRNLGFFVGELIWNFADFMTKQDITRVGGNKKGMFTRSREPKAAARHLRERYRALAAADEGRPAPPPSYYVSDNKPYKHIEM